LPRCAWGTPRTCFMGNAGPTHLEPVSRGKIRKIGGSEGSCTLVAVRWHPSRRQRGALLIELRVQKWPVETKPVCNAPTSTCLLGRSIHDPQRETSRILGRQLLRSGGLVGATYRAACHPTAGEGPAFQQRTNTSWRSYSIPARGFTAAVSVFKGTPPAKPFNCRIWFNPGARFGDQWAHPVG